MSQESSGIWAVQTFRGDPDDMREERGGFFTTKELADEYARRLASMEGREEVGVWEIAVQSELPVPSTWYEVSWNPRRGEFYERDPSTDVDGVDRWDEDPYVEVAGRSSYPGAPFEGTITVHSKDRDVAWATVRNRVTKSRSRGRTGM